MNTSPDIFADAPYPLSADPAICISDATTCQCLMAERQIQPQLTRLLYPTHTGLDGLDAAIRPGRDLDWTGTAAGYFRAELDALALRSAPLRERLALALRLLTMGSST